MMKCVMISIHPKWCSLIVDGRKTIELRKSKPKIPLPFKCYIYMTKGFASYRITHNMWCHNSGGMCVIGEFVCDSILGHCEMANADIAEYASCVRREDILKYANGKEVFGWHISDFVIYDNPKSLSEFYKECAGLDNTGLCYECENAVGEECDCGVNGRLHITRPPQSWCYVEELR